MNVSNKIQDKLASLLGGKNKNRTLAHDLTESMQAAQECKLTSICCVSNVFSVASTDEELDLREQCLKVRDVGHGKLHKSRITKAQYKHQLDTAHIN